ncbi:MAG: hypothetical protein N838_12410 [Thiohalocapsa sp. PB-PSB1]|nr:MAG: hypothetical protein N838_12410 [Thiohalocapsa sp. PB-PSB1]
MTRSGHRAVKRFVTVIRGFRDVAQPRSARRPNARQALPFSFLRRLLDRGAAPAFPRRTNGADGLTTLCN